MSNIELAPENPFSSPLQDTSQSSAQPNYQLNSGHRLELITDILAIAVLRNRFRRRLQAD